MKRIAITIAACLIGVGAAHAQEDDADSMAELLQRIEQGQARDSAEARQREQRFVQARNEQQNLLNQARAERTRQENNSQRLENLFAENQQQILDARTALDRRLGALKELFGVLQTVSGDAQGRFSNSLTNIQYSDREEFLVELGNKMASASSLASIEDIEKLWYELQREVTEQGKIVRFNYEIATADGERVSAQVARVGVFNLAFEDGYLSYDPVTGNVSELQRQPEQARFTGSAADMIDSNGGTVRFGLDVRDGTRAPEPPSGYQLVAAVDVPFAARHTGDDDHRRFAVEVHLLDEIGKGVGLGAIVELEAHLQFVEALG